MIWNLVIVTARTAQQRWLFERYLSRLWASPGGRGGPDYLVLRDPSGPQLGTAGATVHALCAACDRLGPRFAAARVLVLHCGGLSQRVPQLSHLGKAFAPGPAPGGDAALFAQIVGELDRLFQDMQPGAVVACGDVLYSAPRLDAACRTDEAVAVACRAPAEQCSRHGVYLWEVGRDRVADAWQKPPVARLLALDDHQAWALDTGILYLGARVVREMLTAVGAANVQGAPAAFLRRKQDWQGVELYRDLTPAMTLAWRHSRRLVGAPGDVQETLSRFPLRLTCPAGGALLHFGTNQELIRILSADDRPRLYASYVAKSDLGPGVVLDRCFSEAPIAVGAGSYVSGLSRSDRELVIGASRVVYQLPLRRRSGSGSRYREMAAGAPGLTAFVTLGVHDDVKCHPEQGATLVGEPLQAWLQELGLSSAAIWEGVPGAERSLWNARLFPVGEEATVAESVPWLTDPADGCFGERVDRWRRQARLSMAEASRLFDARRWWTHERRIRAHRFAARLEAAVRAGDGSAVSELLCMPDPSAAAKRWARRRLRAVGLAEPASLTGARAWLVTAALSPPGRTEGGRSGSAPAGLRELGFRTLSRALVCDREISSEPLAWQLAPGEWVEVRAPVRVDLAGGWTDTPPQACERGGMVLNLALLLEGRRPIAARVERLEERVIEVVAEDLGCWRVLASERPPRRGVGPRDPFGIHWAALRLLGLFSGPSLPQQLRRLGGGLRVTTASQVPEGSGLGTSSILGAALLAALNEAFGRRLSPEALCRDVLRLEQLMGTGGGWQDQVGGMWSGAKRARTAPGIGQCPEVERLSLSPEVERGLAERMVLFYTGEPRLARDVLQRVVGRYLVGEPATLAALDEMPDLVERACSALQGGDWPALGACLSRSWTLNQQLEPTCANPALTALFSRIAPFVSGAKLAGAGGGGFLFALARDSVARFQLEAMLTAIPPPAKLYPASLDTQGFTITRQSR